MSNSPMFQAFFTSKTTKRMFAPLSTHSALSPTPMQSTKTKLGILQCTCGDQASQAERYGRAADAAEWLALRELIAGLG
jgi:hypothetical protein